MDGKVSRVYSAWPPEIAHLDLQIWSGGALRLVNQFWSNNDPTLHYKSFEWEGAKAINHGSGSKVYQQSKLVLIIKET